MKCLLILYLILIQCSVFGAEIEYLTQNNQFKINTTKKIFHYQSTGLILKLFRNECSNRVLSQIEQEFINMKKLLHIEKNITAGHNYILIDAYKYLIIPNSSSNTFIKNVPKRMLTIEKEINLLCQK